MVSTRLSRDSATGRHLVHMRTHRLGCLFLRFKASTVGLENSSFTFLNASSRADPHNHAFLGLRSSRRGCEHSARLGLNFPIWLTMPMNLLSSSRFFGASSMALVFSGSDDIPSFPTTWLEKVSDSLLNSH